ncbi:MAG: transposase [Candidatus Thermoplasmatota archaeon]|nr:transposase [Candidatus Thermoplasmatota archaeon]
MVQKRRMVYIIPVSTRITKHKLAELEHIYQNYPKLVQWFLTVFAKEQLDFTGMNIRHAMDIVEKLCYPTKNRETRYNCKGAVHLPQSHYYYTAITEAIQKWNSFQSWKQKRKRAGKPIKKKFPTISKYAPIFDSTMFNLDLENGWITINSKSINAGLNIPVTIPNKKRYQDLDAEKIPSIKLTRNRRGRFVFHLIQSMSKQANLPSSNYSDSKVTAFAIDLGERHLVAMTSVELTADDHFFNKVKQRVRFHDGSRAKQSAYIEHHIRRALQNKGKGHRIPNRTWHTKDIRRQEVLDIVNDILSTVSDARNRGKVFVFIGDLKAPVMRNKGSLSRRLCSYPRGELKDLLIDRLQKAGIDVQLVHEYRTSVTCHQCGSTNTKRIRQGLFICHDCKLRYNADANGAWNILGRGVRRRKSSKNSVLALSVPQILDKWVECALGALP